MAKTKTSTAKTKTKTKAKAAKAKAKTAAKAAKAKTAAAKTSVAKPSARDRGLTIDQYIAGLSAEYQAIAQRLMAIVRSVVPKVSSSIKWGQPVFEHGGPMIWMKAFAKHFGFGFWRGADLPDPKGLLEGAGDRMRHVKLRSAADIDERTLKALVRAAAEANQAKGDPTKRG